MAVPPNACVVDEQRQSAVCLNASLHVLELVGIRQIGLDGLDPYAVRIGQSPVMRADVSRLERAAITSSPEADGVLRACTA